MPWSRLQFLPRPLTCHIVSARVYPLIYVAMAPCCRHCSSERQFTEEVLLKRKQLLSLARNNSEIKKLDRYQLLHITELMHDLTDYSSADLVAQVMGVLRFMPLQHSTEGASHMLSVINRHLVGLRKSLTAGEELLSLKQLGKCIGNLRNMKSSDSSAVSFIRFAAEEMLFLQYSQKKTLRPSHIGNLVYGIRFMNSDVIEVRRLVYQISVVISNCQEEFSVESIGSMMYGMQSLRNNCQETNALLHVCCKVIQACQHEFGPQQIGNCLYGLQSMLSHGAPILNLLVALTPKIWSCTTTLNGQEIGNAVYGLKSMENGAREVDELLVALAYQIRISRVDLSSGEFCMAIYGLKCMNETAAVTDLISALLKCVDGKILNFGAQNVANALFGLQKMKADSQEVRRLLVYLTMNIKVCNEAFESKELGSALYGLKSMSCETREVRELIQELCLKIETTKGPISALTLTNALYGLQNMDNTSAAAKSLLTILAAKFRICYQPFRARDIGSALYGLQCMSTCVNVAPLEAVLSALLKKVATSPDRIDGQSLSNALYGMQSMSSDNSYVRDMLGALARIALPTVSDPQVNRLTKEEFASAMYGLQSCRSDCHEVKNILHILAESLRDISLVKHWESRDIGRALFGLQNMNSNCTAVLWLLEILGSKIIDVKKSMSPQALGLSFYAMRHMSTEKSSVQDILQYFLAQLQQLQSDSEVLDKHSPHWIRDLCRYLRLSSFHSQGWWDQNYRDLIHQAAVDLSLRLKTRECNDTISSCTTGELHVYKSLKTFFAGNPLVSVEVNQYLFDFEADVVIRFFGSIRTNEVINIELDGAHHDFPAKKQFSQSRDAYLLYKQGIYVLRYRLENLHYLTQEFLIRDLNRVIFGGDTVP